MRRIIGAPKCGYVPPLVPWYDIAAELADNVNKIKPIVGELDDYFRPKTKGGKSMIIKALERLKDIEMKEDSYVTVPLNSLLWLYLGGCGHDEKVHIFRALAHRVTNMVRQEGGGNAYKSVSALPLPPATRLRINQYVRQYSKEENLKFNNLMELFAAVGYSAYGRYTYESELVHTTLTMATPFVASILSLENTESRNERYSASYSDINKDFQLLLSGTGIASVVKVGVETILRRIPSTSALRTHTCDIATQFVRLFTCLENSLSNDLKCSKKINFIFSNTYIW